MGLKGKEREHVMKIILALNEKLAKESSPANNVAALDENDPALLKKGLAQAQRLTEEAKLKDVRAARKRARAEFKLNNKPIPYIFKRHTLGAILSLSGAEKKYVKKKMAEVEAEIKADKNHKELPAAAKKLDEAEEKAIETMAAREVSQQVPIKHTTGPENVKEDDLETKVKQRMTRGAEVIIDPVLRKEHDAESATKNAVGPAFTDAVVQKKKLAAIQEENQARKHKAKMQKTVCIPKAVNMEYVSSLRHMVADLNDEIEEQKNAGVLIDDKKVSQADKLRNQVQSVFVDTCRNVPIGIAGTGIDGFARVNKIMRDFADNQQDDVAMKAKGDIQGRISLEIERAAPACVNAQGNKKLADDAVTSACFKQVMMRVKGIIADQNQPLVQPID